MKFTGGKRAYSSILDRLTANSVPADRGHVSLCWEWIGKRDRKGYGRMNVWIPGKGARHVGPHRLALAIKLGVALVELPETADAAHQCHNRACINPDHIELRTRSANVREAIERATAQGRLWRPSFLEFVGVKNNGKANANSGGTSRAAITAEHKHAAGGWKRKRAPGFDSAGGAGNGSIRPDDAPMAEG